MNRASVATMVAAVTFGATLAACAPEQRSGDGDGGTGHEVDGSSGLIDGGDGFIDATPPIFDDSGVTENCNVLPATVRDFHVSHPDFEHFTTDAISPGIVAPTLGADGTPTWASLGTPPCTTGATEFAQWYHDVAGVNKAIPIKITLTHPPGSNLSIYDNSAFFPVDGVGFGNEGFAHNFAFTTEIHTSFKYKGGEQFTFRGDDDLWLFINGKLAIDLGGLHQPQQQVLNLDAQAATLGIVVGNSYHMDIFHAERHSTASNFRIETTIECLAIP